MPEETAQPPRNEIGIVAIGRNEGQRLVSCLRSLSETKRAIVYVDSGSTDGSVAIARKMGADVVNLDMNIPFTAARARNAGCASLLKVVPALKYVQFVDGDCFLDAEWINAAGRFLDENPGVACVCGRRKERFPNASFYNMLCDAEWDTPIGEATQCGGDAMFRVGSFTAVGGYRGGQIAGEEPELCIRLRENNWKIVRLDHAMTSHDADIHRFGQWWNRSVRAGYAYASVVFIHFNSPKSIWKRQLARSIAWGFLLPCAILVCFLYFWPLGAAALALYPLQIVRTMFRCGMKPLQGLRYSFLLMVTKFSEALGIMKFFYQLATGKAQRLIEYK